MQLHGDLTPTPKVHRLAVAHEGAAIANALLDDVPIDLTSNAAPCNPANHGVLVT
jgi:hypothetical protein